MISVRQFMNIDYYTLNLLLKDLQEEDKLTDNFDIELKMIDYYKEYLKNPNYDLLVAEDNHNIRGFILGERYKDVYSVRMNYVHKDYRRRGLGLILKDQLVKHARLMGCKTIESIIRNDNIASIKMNESAGWTRVREWYKYSKDLTNDQGQ